MTWIDYENPKKKHESPPQRTFQIVQTPLNSIKTLCNRPETFWTISETPIDTQRQKHP